MAIVTRTRVVVAVLLAGWLGAVDASAQVFGTFSWRMEPYCNVVTLTLSQLPTGYTVDGYDNQCGAGKLASATGQTLINPDGTVGITFSIVTSPGGKDVHVAAVISPGTGSGTWTDSVGNTGQFLLGAPGAGSPRPAPASGLPAAVITATELSNNSVTGAKVVNGSLSSVDLSDAPRAAFADGEQLLNLTPAAQVVRSISIIAPAAGRVVVNASLEWRANSAAGLDLGRCSISTSTALDFDHLHRFGEETGTTVATTLTSSYSATRGFNVPAGTFTANIVCDEFQGDLTVRDSSMTAMYFPG